MEENGIWKEVWKVGAFMVDTNQRIRLKSLADILQELANNHANYRKCGFEDMKARGKFWVLNRQVIDILQWPIWEQDVKVESWISMMKGPFSLRHFAVYDTDDRLLSKASYLWTCIDRKKMKPATIPDGNFPIVADRYFELPEPRKIRIKGDIQSEQSYTVRNSDQDIIGHTNNATYLEWASNIISAVIPDFHRIEANYTGESFTGQEVMIQLLQDEATEQSVQVLNAEQKSIFKMKIYK